MTIYAVNFIFGVFSVLCGALIVRLWGVRHKYPGCTQVIHFLGCLGFCTGYWTVGYPPGVSWVFWGGVVTMTPATIALARVYFFITGRR